MGLSAPSGRSPDVAEPSAVSPPGIAIRPAVAVFVFDRHVSVDHALRAAVASRANIIAAQRAARRHRVDGAVRHVAVNATALPQPKALLELSVWWLRLGIAIERIKPGQRSRHRLRPALPASNRINIAHVLAGQKLGIKEVDEGIWLVSLMSYDLGYFDLEQRTLQPLDNPFGTRLSPMS